MRLVKEEQIPKISFISSVSIVLLMTLTIGGVLIHEKQQGYKKRLEWIETTYVNNQKNKLKTDVNIQIRRVKVLKQSAEARLKETLQQRVSQVHAIATSLYDFNKNQSREMVQALICDALGKIRFNQGRGYFFILDKSGTIVLYPPDPAQKGKSLNSKTAQGLNIPGKALRDQIRKKAQGFIKYKWAKPDDPSGPLFPKITYTRRFEPYSWTIGSGEYIETFEQNLQKEIISRLNTLEPNKDAPGYIFIYKPHSIEGGDEFATLLVNPNRPDLVGKKISDSTGDANEFQFRKAMLESIRKEGEGFITYYYKKPGRENQVQKLSYFKHFPQWNWIIAKGVYLDDMEKEMTLARSELQTEIREAVHLLGVFLVSICAIFLFLAYLFSKGVKKLFEGYKQQQEDYKANLRRLNLILEKKAETDPLTRVNNREAFNRQLANETARANRYGTGLALILFDIDHFKQINDRFGHISGDRVLKKVAELSTRNIRSSDTFARWGGEEFVILTPENSENQAFYMAEKLRQLFASFDFPDIGRLTSSFGVTLYRDQEDREAFISRADKALYQSKQKGRNQTTLL